MRQRSRDPKKIDDGDKHEEQANDTEQNQYPALHFYTSSFSCSFIFIHCPLGYCNMLPLSYSLINIGHAISLVLVFGFLSLPLAPIETHMQFKKK